MGSTQPEAHLLNPTAHPPWNFPSERNTRMKRTWALPCFTALFLFATQGILNAQTTFNASGEFGQTFANVNGTQLFVFAARGCTTSPCFTSNTILILNASTPLPNGVVFTSGAGVIPDSAFQADSPEHATLNRYQPGPRPSNHFVHADLRLRLYLPAGSRGCDPDRVAPHAIQR